MRYILVSLLSVFLLFYGCYSLYMTAFYKPNRLIEIKQELLYEMSQKEYQENSFIAKASAAEVVIKKEEIKDLYDLEVFFYPQSPFGKWGPIFNDTCEEASLLLALNYVTDTTMTRVEFRDELLKMVDWQKKEFGTYIHTSVEQTAKMLKEVYGFTKFRIIDEPSVDDIKGEISNGNIIIAPFYGIGMNPYFTDNGPEYHFIVIKGYTEDSFITHEVGTKRGENYIYTQADLMDRLHDYDPVSVKKNGKKRLIVLEK